MSTIVLLKNKPGHDITALILFLIIIDMLKIFSALG